MANPPTIFACDLAALTADRRADHPADALPANARERVIAVSQEVFALAQQAHDLPDGYLIRLPDVTNLLAKLAEFVELNRRCCPFLRFRIIVEPHGGAISLELTGEPGAKAAIAVDVARFLPVGVAPC